MSEYRLVIQPEAELDLLAARDWYGSLREGLGREFIQSVDAALDPIHRMPMTIPWPIEVTDSTLSAGSHT